MDIRNIANLVASGKKTDADGTDRTIVTEGFTRFRLDCIDATGEMTFTIDEAISGATKPIYVKNGYVLELDIVGATLHYSGSGTFRYVMTK